MRISDWSSDVCSSDLARDGGGLAGAGAAGNQGEALAQHGPRGQRLAVERAGLQGKQARERGIVRSLGQRVTAGAEGVGEVLLVAGVTAQRDHAVRVEEHTSELQSLMRTSVAVFFLKNIIYTIKLIVVR